MTTEELHKILFDEKKILSIKEFQEVIYRLEKDCFKFYCDCLESNNYLESQFYMGEQNAFYIALMLTEHLEKR